MLSSELESRGVSGLWPRERVVFAPNLDPILLSVERRAPELPTTLLCYHIGKLHDSVSVRICYSPTSSDSARWTYQIPTKQVVFSLPVQSVTHSCH